MSQLANVQIARLVKLKRKMESIKQKAESIKQKA